MTQKTRIFIIEEKAQNQKASYNEDSFAMLDDVLDWCETYQVYAVVDFHAATAGQSGIPCDDGVDNGQHLYDDEESMERMFLLMEEFMRRYKDRWIIGAYDCINEPISMTPRREELTPNILAAQKQTGERISHVVVMGTGEPFDNYENLAAFIRIINDRNGLDIGMRNITVSTCGLVPKIARFAEDFPQVNLAISLHAASDEMRSEIMPVNKTYPMETLLEACKDYTEKTSRRITFEYTLVKGVNDSTEHAKMLTSRLRGMLCHVNLIPLNKVEETGYDTTERGAVIQFQKVLNENGIPATIRRELGDDIDAACGQLRLSES